MNPDKSVQCAVLEHLQFNSGSEVKHSHRPLQNTQVKGIPELLFRGGTRNIYIQLSANAAIIQGKSVN